MNVIDDRERGSAGQAQGGGMRQGWTWKPLGEVCKTGSGGTPLSSRKDFYEGGTIPWLVSGEVAQGNVLEAKNFITAAGLENSAAKLFPRDTVLVAMYGATAGQVGILRFEAATNQAVCGILPNDKFVPEFLYYFLLAKKDDLVAQATGNAQPNISQIKIKNTAVPVLPLPEQQRIVALLDEAFAGLATAKANAERNLQNARALFESHLQSVFTQRRSGWVERTLGELIEIQNGYAFKSIDYTDNGYFLIRIGNVQDGEITLANPRFIKLTDKKLERFILNEGDILVSLTGNIGRVGIIQKDQLPAVLNQRVARITIKDKNSDSDFLFRFLLSQAFRVGLQEAGHGAAQQNVSTKEIESIQISLPDKKEQHRIVEKFNIFAVEAQRLTRIYERKLAALEELKKSLLHQAFNGEL